MGALDASIRGRPLACGVAHVLFPNKKKTFIRALNKWVSSLGLHQKPLKGVRMQMAGPTAEARV